MPIVTTLAIIALLNGDSRSNCAFFEPGLLRDLLKSGLRDDEPEQEASLALADELDVLLDRYATRVNSALDAYLETSMDPTIGATELTDQLEPLDRERADTMREIIDIRQRLLGLLNEEQWSRVFPG